jgi:hypothetical protein
MKKLYSVTACSVVYAKDEQQALECLLAHDTHNLFNTDSSHTSVEEIDCLDNIPSGWWPRNCPVDADKEVSISKGPWADDCIEGILKKQKQATPLTNIETAQIKKLYDKIESLENMIKSALPK